MRINICKLLAQNKTVIAVHEKMLYRDLIFCKKKQFMAETLQRILPFMRLVCYLYIDHAIFAFFLYK